MNELIKVTTNENGDQLTSGRELHEFLEVATEYKDWFPRMVKYGFVEDVDFSAILSESTGGRPKLDHALTLGMAKEISMIQRSEKGKQARQYFIQVEEEYKQLKLPTDPMEILALTFEAQKQANKKLEIVNAFVSDVDNRVTKIEENSPIHPSYLHEITKKRLARVTLFLGGKESQAYKDTSFRNSVYAEAARDFKKRFKVSKYDLTLSKDIPLALRFFDTWMPKEETLSEIRRLNTQIELLEEE